MADIRLGPVNSLITITPGWAFEQTLTLTSRQDQRTKTGNLFTYVETGRHRRFRLPWSWVSSSDRSLVNSWWQTATDLSFVLETSSFDVRIMGSEEPFQSFVRPHGPGDGNATVFYDGEIVIETI